MTKLFDFSFVGLKTGIAEIDALASSDVTRLAITTVTAEAQDFDAALTLARKVVDSAKAKGRDARIWGVVEVDPEAEDDEHEYSACEEEDWDDD